MAGKETEVATAVGPGGHEELPGCVIWVAEGSPEDQGRHLSLKKGSATVGSSSDCDLCLHDPQVSRRHAELAVDWQGIDFRDLGSTNGSFYLSNRISRATLAVGARVRLGKTVLALLPLADAGIEPDPSTSYGALVGASVPMRRLFGILRRLEGSDAPVLISGETGTGKELVARSIHDESERRDQPFVVLDCGSIARELIDSELFGHVKGAFTGAVSDRAGVFELANGGTLFLDEIGELPVEQQPRLLRALETGEVRRVGGDERIAVDLRVVAATHRNLSSAIDDGTFREDLYYRLAVVTIEVPPLRERLEDVPLLARHLAAELKEGAELSDGVVNLMTGHDWPGNVRELRNAVQRLLSLGRFDAPDTKTAGPSVDVNLPYKEAREKLLNQFEAEYVRSLIERHDGNISQAAREAGIARQYFRELLRKHGLYDG